MYRMNGINFMLISIFRTVSDLHMIKNTNVFLIQLIIMIIQHSFLSAIKVQSYFVCRIPCTIKKQR